MLEKIWIGLDVGTTNIKAGAYLSDGTCLAQSDQNTSIIRGAHGVSEQNMEDVWQAVVSCLSDIVQACQSNDEYLYKIVSLGICAQGDGLWCIDANGKPAQNAMLWNDTRASKDLDRLAKAGKTEDIGRRSGTSLWPGTSGMLWHWLQQNQREVAGNVKTAFSCADWIGFCLTGQIAMDYANASIPFMDLKARAYTQKQFDDLECQDLQGKTPAPQAAQTPLGPIKPDVAQLTGLPEDICISTGTLDLASMIVGMGLNKPDQTMLIMGTTAVVSMLTDKVSDEPYPVGATTCHATDDLFIRILAPSTGAAAFDWFTQLHPQTLGGDTSQEVAEKLNELVTEVPVGANGVLFMPYLNGERAPFVSPDICGSFYGMRASTTKADLGCAVMEGTALSLRHCFESHSALPTVPVHLTGGGSKNHVWCQIIADVIGQDVIVSPQSDLGLWGAAAIGASAAGLGDPIALSKRDTPTTTYRANSDAHQAYSTIYKRYECTSRALQNLQDQLNNLGSTSQ